ncbi:MAG: N-acetylmuramidase family protein [Muribaculaceae bacterium]|nr:N-acetylmuramidase family protein [Muribaculaceae bacterium]
MNRTLTAFALGIALLCGAMPGCAKPGPTPDTTPPAPTEVRQTDSLPAADAATRYKTLTDADFKIVADELGVEIAAIKAVVSIEAGPKMEGFWAPGIPIINFDRTMYNRVASRAPVKTGAKGEKVPAGLKGYALQEWTQLINARRNNAQGANMGTFWGMFQIGGFNYKLCGCQSVDEMVKRMSYSELEQLELFATFITKSGMLSDLKAKNWAGFARKYNGPSYAKRGYHTKMANAYKKFKAQEKTGDVKPDDTSIRGKSLSTPTPSTPTED